ncbi:hypothetical protein C2S52_007215 [Perilla frutescens var. hirtella]|nr:hypothetical protein C2S52_007215 [Perilla frutescens var. hirtella]
MEGTRDRIDAATRGTLLELSAEEAMELLERMAANSAQWPSQRNSVRRVTEVSASSNNLKELTVQMSTMAKAITLLTKNNVALVDNVPEQVAAVHDDVADVNYMQGRGYNNNYRPNQGGNPYNQFGQRNSDKLSYRNPNNFQQPPPGFSTTNRVINGSLKPDLENILGSFMTATKQRMDVEATKVDNLTITFNKFTTNTGAQLK